MSRIDVHQHIVPPQWAQALGERGLTSGGWAIPSWNPQSAIEMMDAHSIATGVLSVTAPGVNLDADARGAARLARDVNTFGAEVARDHPGRFGSFASIPLPHVGAAVEEARYALD